MSVSPGSRIGVYEVISIVGRGGMGEVYRARDTRLARDVALKLLPDAGQASDVEWRARFEREARALASLNHPNIAAIYGLEENGLGQTGSASATAIVMELVHGETLADRLTRGAVPLDEALNIAGQIADALEAAHQRGIVHRDLKPANVKITPAGTVKVLDFGLAKFLADPAHDDITLSEMTAPAVVLGTPAYMAPEQAQGRSADRRVDVWAFGVVLYETVTGKRLFRGESLQETLAAVLTAEPDWARVPPAVRPLLRACLERDPLKRLRDIGDYRFLLAPPEAAPRGRRTPRRSLLIATAAIATTILAFYAGKSLTRTDGASAPAPIRLSTMLPAGVSVTRGPGYTSSVAVSPDGRTIVIAASDENGQRLYRRSLDRLDPTPLAGSERGSSPFFSWDGEWIGFFADGRVKRIPAAGGASIDVSAAPGFPSGASWGPDDRIVFAYGADSYLHIVPAEGGSVERLTDESPGRQPEVLPDGRTVLFEAAGDIHAYDRQSGAITKLLPGTAPRYANGHVIFSRGTTLLAAPFDIERSSTGAAIPVAEGVAVELPGSGGGRHYAISRGGSLVYVPAADAYELNVVGGDAVERVIGQPQHSLENPRFSPDGRYVVVAASRRADEPTDLWLHDQRAGTGTRLTSDGGRAPIWIDNATIAYSHLGEEQGIYTTRVDGGGDRRRVLALNAFHWLVGWTADRSTLLYGLMMEGKGSSIMAYSNTQSRTVVGPRNTWGGRLSRDGKWLAYYVLDSGTFEIYVTPFPEGDARWLIAEGTDPSWGPDGNEIYYRSGPRLMAARVDKAAGVKVVANRVVIDPFLPPLYDDYDIHPDGRTLVMVRPANQTQDREVTMVLGWFNEFRPADR
jgi:serine/threonine-protein kinase